MARRLSRRDFLRGIAAGGLALMAGFSKVLGSDDGSRIPNTNISLDDHYLVHVKRTNECINIDDGRCTYGENGNCSKCYMLEYFVTEDFP